jgi:hypothetical protein
MDDAGSTLAGTAVAFVTGRSGSVVESGRRTGGFCLGSRAFCARSAAESPHEMQQFEEWAGLGKRIDDRVVEDRCRMAG